MTDSKRSLRELLLEVHMYIFASSDSEAEEYELPSAPRLLEELKAWIDAPLSEAESREREAIASSVDAWAKLGASSPLEWSDRIRRGDFTAALAPAPSVEAADRIPEDVRRKMYVCAPMLGEPACTELRKVLDALDSAEDEIATLRKATDAVCDVLSETADREAAFGIEAAALQRVQKEDLHVGRWRDKIREAGEPQWVVHDGGVNATTGSGNTLVEALADYDAKKEQR